MMNDAPVCSFVFCHHDRFPNFRRTAYSPENKVDMIEPKHPIPTPPRHPPPRRASAEINPHHGRTQTGKATRTEMVPALLMPHPQRHLPRPEPRDGVSVPAGPEARLRSRFPTSLSLFLCFSLPLYRLTPPPLPHIPIDPLSRALHQLHRLPLPAVVAKGLRHFARGSGRKTSRKRSEPACAVVGGLYGFMAFGEKARASTLGREARAALSCKQDFPSPGTRRRKWGLAG
jgi:hypothetical protein